MLYYLKYKIHWNEVGKIQDVRVKIRVALSWVAAEILGDGVLVGVHRYIARFSDKVIKKP